MTQSQPLARGAVGGEQDGNAERRRARVLGKILESTTRLHENYAVPEIMQALIRIAKDLFSDSALLLLAKDSLDPQAPLSPMHNDILGDEFEFAQRLADEVALTGVPSFSADYEMSRDRLACCVPITLGDISVGAIYTTTPVAAAANSDELTRHIRLLVLQAEQALKTAYEIKRLGEELSIMSHEVGLDFADEKTSLTAAKRSFERWLIGARLKKSHGNIAAAARALQMDRGQLSRLVKRHAIDPSSYRS